MANWQVRQLLRTLLKSTQVMVAIALRPATTTSTSSGTTATTTRYFHADHLNSTNVTTNNLGAQIQVLDYYPYEATRKTVPDTDFTGDELAGFGRTPSV